MHSTKQSNLTIQQLKTTLLIDAATSTVLDTRVRTTGEHDTQLAPQVVKGNTGPIAVVTGDNGYDDQKVEPLQCCIGVLYSARGSRTTHLPSKSRC